MFQEPPDHFLYSAYKINLEHSDGHKTIYGVATGFVLTIEGFPWIITNRHVIDRDYKQETPKFKNFKLSKFIITGRDPADKEYSFQLYEGTDFYFHNDYENDVVIIRAKIYYQGSKTLQWHFTMEHLAGKNIFDSVQPFDLICYSGFPNSHDKLNNRPIVRTGTIASDPKHNYSWNSEFQGQCVAYEGFSSEGASGSPIFAPQRGMTGIPNSRDGFLIGVNAGHVPDGFGHSGISYFYKSTVLHEIIDRNNLREISVKAKTTEV